MGFFAGLVDAGPQTFQDDIAWQLQGMGRTYAFGGGKPTVWRGDGAAVVHVPWHTTPEDHFDRLPARFAGGTSVLVFDGRLDNRAELIDELGMDRPEAAVTGDGALAMAALEHWGDDAYPRLLGDFAFAWWDERSRRLTLVGDAVGGRTIYVHAGSGRLCFATHPLAVLAFPGVPREVDTEAIAHSLLSLPLPAGFSLFRGIFRLPPAGRLVWQNGTHRLDRYWRLDPTRRIRFRDRREYAEAGRDLLDRAVSARLRVVGSTVCQLSGGLDSSAVVATAARLMPQTPIHALTNVPEPGIALPPPRGRFVSDEGPMAAELAALYPNVVHHIVPAGGLTADEIDPTRLFAKTGIPVRNALNFGAWQPVFAKARELGARVILVGNAGNATLSWEDVAPGRRWRQYLTRDLAPRFVHRFWRRLRGRRTVDPWGMVSALSRDYAREISPDTRRQHVPFSISSCKHNRALRLRFIEEQWSRNSILSGLLPVVGCEMRDPLSDRRLTEFCFAIPDDQWQLDGVPRSLARRVLADRLPASVLNFRGRGYQTAGWFHRLTGLRESLVAEIDRLEGSPTARRLLDLERLRAMADDWPADAAAAEPRMDELLVAFGRTVYFGTFIRWVEGSNR